MRQIVVAGLLILSACGQPVPSGGGRQGGTGVSGRWHAEDACDLLGKETVGAALGTEVTATALAGVTPRTDAAAGSSTCFYRLGNGQQVAFMARQSPVPDNDPQAFARVRAEVAARSGPVREVTGVGRAAFWVPRLRQLNVFVGDDRFFSLTMPADLGDKDPKTLALGLATRIE